MVPYIRIVKGTGMKRMSALNERLSESLEKGGFNSRSLAEDWCEGMVVRVH